jgi:GTP cyclohydrolase I
MIYLTNKELLPRAQIVATKIGGKKKIYGVPRGGIPAAYLVASCDTSLEVVDDLGMADAVVDDIVDSGATRSKYTGKPFFALYDKTGEDRDLPWIVFPWEASNDSSINDNIIRLLQYVGENPDRGGLLETPKRVAKAWSFWTKGYNETPAEILKVFEDGAEDCDQMVVVKDIPIYSHCEHHMAAIFGTCSIAYIPNGKIVGLSKLSRLADIFARRLQVQERLTNQIADALDENLSPLGVGVIIKARHLCMESRGICQQGHHTVTSALRGAIKSDPEARAEFMQLCR